MDLITSPTDDQQKLLASLAKVKIIGKADFSSAVQIAQIALKYRKNLTTGTRIIVFVGSPVTETPEELEAVAIKLKRNNIALDVISIGELEHNQEKLIAFVNSVNKEDNRYLAFFTLLNTRFLNSTHRPN